MRTNIDFGPAVLPVGDVLERNNALPSTSKTEKDAGLLAAMLTDTFLASHENYKPESKVGDLLSSVQAGDPAFDEKKLYTHLEQACFEIRRDEFLEISIKVAAEILPETWVNIRKTVDGLHIDIGSTSDEIRHWLHSVTTRLSVHLNRQLQCMVHVAVCAEKCLAHHVDQEILAKHARDT